MRRCLRMSEDVFWHRRNVWRHCRHSMTLSAKHLLISEIQLAKLDFFGNDRHQAALLTHRRTFFTHRRTFRCTFKRTLAGHRLPNVLLPLLSRKQSCKFHCQVWLFDPQMDPQMNLFLVCLSPWSIRHAAATQTWEAGWKGSFINHHNKESDEEKNTFFWMLVDCTTRR